jgi:putative FmdB family regulatory protein
MPIYEYLCEECGQRHEALQRLSDSPLTECPECDRPALRKLISAAAFRLAGGGWYETDFKKGNRRNLVGEGNTGQGDTGKGGTGQGDTGKGGGKPAKAASGEAA